MTAKADRARELMNDEDLKAALKDMRRSYHDRIDDPALSDEQVLRVRDMLHLTRVFEETLMLAIETGNFEDFKAAEQERTEWNRTLQ